MLLLVSYVLVFLAGAAGLFVVLLFFADEGEQRRRITKAPEKKVFLVSDSPENEKTITYH